MTSTRGPRALAVLLCLPTWAAVASCSLLVETENLTRAARSSPVDASDEGRAADATGSTSDAGIDSPNASCAQPTAYALGPEELMGSPPPAPDGGTSFLFGVAGAEGTAYVNVLENYDGAGAAGRIYRVSEAGAWTELVSGTGRADLQVAGGWLFVRERSRTTRLALDCTPPCARDVVATVPDVDDFWVETEASVYLVRFTGEIFHAVRGPLGWSDAFLTQTGLPPTGYTTLAATRDALYVAQLGSTALVRVRKDGKEASALELAGADGDRAGMSVAAACDRVHVRAADGRVFEVDPVRKAFDERGRAPGDLFSRTADGFAVYFGHANAGGLHQAIVGTTTMTQLSATRSVWGVAVDQSSLYYGDHGSPTPATAGRLFRRRKK